ncbi:sporulation sigma-E factor-processing peptidase [Clostridia bacterium]|nr:sporulation sigma-E factor-processing peptidase [Clostridia bacterium]
MDLGILWLMKRILHDQSEYFRIALAALLGAVWLCAVVVFSFPRLLEWICSYGLVSVAMVLIAFPSTKLMEILYRVVCLYFFSFCVGGISNFLFYHTTVGKLRQWFVVALFSIGISYCLFWLWEQRKKSQQNIYEVELIYEGKSFMLKALCDTGNALREPISGQVVSILEYGVCSEVIQKVTSFRYIPYRSVGKNNGFLVGIQMQEMIIWQKEKKTCILKPMIGIYQGVLSRDGRYQMLLHPSLVEEERGVCA